MFFLSILSRKIEIDRPNNIFVNCLQKKKINCIEFHGIVYVCYNIVGSQTLLCVFFSAICNLNIFIFT